MFSSVGAPPPVPILMPGGIGRSVAELLPAEASNAAPPRAILANSLLSTPDFASRAWLPSMKLPI